VALIRFSRAPGLTKVRAVITRRALGNGGQHGARHVAIVVQGPGVGDGCDIGP
jgi:hypothetical protein